MKTAVKVSTRYIGLFGCATLLGACVTTTAPTTTLETITDGLKSTSNAVTNVVSSTTPDSKKSAFVTDRYDAIRFEAAKGEGENIDSLATLLGENDRGDFAQWMKANYTPLFANLKEPKELLARIERRRHIDG